jgi:hypothetical protein
MAETAGAVVHTSAQFSPEELKTIMGVNKDWSYRAELDGQWPRADRCRKRMHGVRLLRHSLPRPNTHLFFRTGWVKAHDAVRADLTDLLSALSAWKERIEKGQAASQWEVSNLKQYFLFFEHAIHHHHDSEEKIFFPFMETRVKVRDPPSPAPLVAA